MTEHEEQINDFLHDKAFATAPATKPLTPEAQEWFETNRYILLDGARRCGKRSKQYNELMGELYKETVEYINNTQYFNHMDLTHAIPEKIEGGRI